MTGTVDRRLCHQGHCSQRVCGPIRETSHIPKSLEYCVMDAIMVDIWRQCPSGCCSHAFQETNSLRRTMQAVKCSLLHQRAQGRVSSYPRTPTSICENLLYPMCMCLNPPLQIPCDLHKQRKGKYNPNNPIIHVLCAQTFKQLANNQ